MSALTLRCAALLALLMVQLPAQFPAYAAEVPMLTGRVVDNASLLSASARETIGAQLKAHEDKTGNQVAVLTIPSLEGDNIEDFATRVFESWKLGKKGKDNGVLLIIVPAEKKMRIEVGRGLEGALTDAHSSRIIRNVMAPHFKARNFDQGVSEGVNTILGQLMGEAAAEKLADISSGSSSSSGFKEPNLPLGERILFGAFIFGIIGLFTVVGVVTPGMGWFLYVFLIPFWALFPIVVVGVKGAMALLGTYIVGFPIAKLAVARTDWYKRQNAGGRRRGGRGRFDGLGHSSGGWSSSSSSGSWGSSSGGGFSGGGGDSGGGGSSGDW